MSLLSKLLDPGAEVFYDPGFRAVFEDHLSLLINNKTTNRSQTVDPNTAARFAGDWRGLMLALSVRPHLHWFNLRLNGLLSTSDFNGDMESVECFYDTAIDSLRRAYMTKRVN